MMERNEYIEKAEGMIAAASEGLDKRLVILGLCMTDDSFEKKPNYVRNILIACIQDQLYIAQLYRCIDGAKVRPYASQLVDLDVVMVGKFYAEAERKAKVALGSVQKVALDAFRYIGTPGSDPNGEELSKWMRMDSPEREALVNKRNEHHRRMDGRSALRKEKPDIKVTVTGPLTCDQGSVVQNAFDAPVLPPVNGSFGEFSRWVTEAIEYFGGKLASLQESAGKIIANVEGLSVEQCTSLTEVMRMHLPVYVVPIVNRVQVETKTTEHNGEKSVMKITTKLPDEEKPNTPWMITESKKFRECDELVQAKLREADVLRDYVVTGSIWVADFLNRCGVPASDLHMDHVDEAILRLKEVHPYYFKQPGYF